MPDQFKAHMSTQGQLSGMSFAAKDVFRLKGHRNTAGNPDWYAEEKPAGETAESVKLLLDEGAALKGVTHTDELMFSLNGQNAHYGTPVNPAAPGRIPGGSSSGSAVAASAGNVDFGLGTDTGGSVRVPSAYQGIYGFRPTQGAVSSHGVIPLAQSFDTPGWMSRSPEVMRAVGQVLLPNVDTWEDQGFKKYVMLEDAWRLVSSSYRALAEDVLEALGGIHYTNLHADDDLQSWFETFRNVQCIEIWENHGRWIERRQPSLGRSLAARFQLAKTIHHETDHSEAYEVLKEKSAQLFNLLTDDMLLVVPTAVGAAPSRDFEGPQDEARRAATMQLTSLSGNTGLPQLTVPLGWIEGGPVGLSFIASYSKDIHLLKWAEHQASTHDLFVPARVQNK